ncbi:MAG: hypothetical protein HXY38_05630 [Chloroflexi bacterium]|nr:hypothetical protein [Chloroflexota bacterium]
MARKQKQMKEIGIRELKARASDVARAGTELVTLGREPLEKLPKILSTQKPK